MLGLASYEVSTHVICGVCGLVLWCGRTGPWAVIRGVGNHIHVVVRGRTWTTQGEQSEILIPRPFFLKFIGLIDTFTSKFSYLVGERQV